MRVYDQEKEKQLYRPGDHDDLGVHPERREAEADSLRRQFNAGDAEADAAPGPTGSKADNSEQKKLADTGGGDSEGGTSLASRARNKLKGTPKRKVAIGGGFVGLGVGGIAFLGSILSGPAQIISFAKTISLPHLGPVEDFGDDRGSKVLLYALIGAGAERGRLGVVSNKAADLNEKKMLKDLGIRPVYMDGSRRFAGYEVVDEDKAKQSGIDNRLEEAGGKSTTNTQGINSGGKKDDFPIKGRLIVLDGSFKSRRAAEKAVGKSMHNSRLVAYGTSRMMIKRGGVNFHPFNNIKRKADEKIADYNKRVRDEEAKQVREGVDETKKTMAGSTEGEDGEEKPPSDADIEASDGANEAIDQASDAVGSQQIKAIMQSIARTSSGPAIVVGIMCAAKGFGDDIPGYRYQHQVLPLYRIGMGVIAKGDQVANGGDSFNLEEMGALSEALYDPETGTSWRDAMSIQAAYGKEDTGVDLYSEQKLAGVNDKPWLLEALDSVPALGQVCDALDFVGGLPVISHVSDFVSNIVGGAADKVLEPLFGVTVAELGEKALGAAAGQSINLAARGAEYGGQADLGAFIGANDLSMATGGAPLSSKQALERRDHTKQQYAEELKSQSFATRYFDIESPDSLANNIVGHMPASSSQFASVLSNPLEPLTRTLGNVTQIFTPKAAAAASAYDYGMPTMGFSLAEQSSDTYEDPYENAIIVERKLDELNDKYSKCFGIKIEPNDSTGGVKLINDGLNYFALKEKGEHKDCDPAKNNDPDLTRYRFYIADVTSAKALSCVMADDEEACTELGMSSGPAAANSLGGNLRVASYNVRGWGHTNSPTNHNSNEPWPPTTVTDADNRMEITIQTIEDNYFDVIGFQEFQSQQYDAFKTKFNGAYKLTKKDGGSSLTQNAIAWNDSKFKLLEQGVMPDLKYFSGKPGGLQAPWVKLEYKAVGAQPGGQQIYVLNTHDPANANGCDCSQERTYNANKHHDFITQLKASGIPIIFTGDFNSKFTNTGPGNGYPLDGKDENLTYCILTRNGFMKNAYDLSVKREAKCPNPPKNGDKNHIDHIYVSPELTVNTFKTIAGGYTSNGSDHPTIYADIVIPGMGNSETIGQPNKAGWVWPVPSVKSLGILPYGATGSKGVHKGIDIGRGLGATVVAAHAGTVDRVWGQGDACGAYVSIKATGTNYYAAYQHLNGSSISVEAGDPVSAGTPIGKIGTQGGSTCGSSGFYHLHFSIENKPGMVSAYADPFPNGTIDPLSVLPR